MWRYLKAAFFSRVPVPGLGEVPANVLGVAAFGILGVVNSGFWFLGSGLEAIFLWSLASNARFQRSVNAAEAHGRLDSGQRRRDLIAALSRDCQGRMDRLSDKCRRVERVFGDLQADDFVVETNVDALRRLEWVYLKLLVARDHLVSNAGTETE